MIMQEFGRKAYKDLSETGRKEFQALFWAARTPEAGAKFQSRLDCVSSYDRYFVKYTFAFVQPNQRRITQTTGNRCLGELETYSRKVTFGAADEAAYKQALDAFLKKK